MRLIPDMSQYSPSWSRTQRDLFFKCPTAWALRYARIGTSGSGPRFEHITAWNMMLRALKATIIEQLDALRSGIEWTASVAEIALRANLKDLIRQNNERIGPAKLDALLQFATHRMKLLWRTDVFLHLSERTGVHWSVLDRTESEHVDGFDLFASPDLVVRKQSQWHLIRLDMQARRMSAEEQLEALVMVLWSLKRSGLPSTVEQFEVQTIGWRKGAWVVHRLRVKESEVLTAYEMIRKDITAMKACAEVARYSIESIPLAANETSCQQCSFKRRCLGDLSLGQKKRLRVKRLDKNLQ